MTIPTVTTERLKQIASGNAFTCTQDDESASMAAELLAVREAQPVWVDTEIHDVIQDILQGGMSRAGRYVSFHKNQYPKGFKQLMPIYTAPPAPAVPDVAAPNGIEILASTYAPRGVTYQWDADECNAATDSWNACRAAMLTGGKP